MDGCHQTIIERDLVTLGYGVYSWSFTYEWHIPLSFLEGHQISGA